MKATAWGRRFHSTRMGVRERLEMAKSEGGGNGRSARRESKRQVEEEPAGGCAGTCVWTCAGRGPGQRERLGHIGRVRIAAGGSRAMKESVFLGVAGCGKANTGLTAPNCPRTVARTGCRGGCRGAGAACRVVLWAVLG